MLYCKEEMEKYKLSSLRKERGNFSTVCNLNIRVTNTKKKLKRKEKYVLRNFKQ